MTYVPGGGGGSGSVSTSSDVALNNVANNEVLTYDSVIAKWKNASVTASTVPADGSITDVHISATAAIAESKLALVSDAVAATPSRRTLGTGAQQAFPGNGRLDQLAQPTVAVNLGGQKAINAADPTAANDLVTKQYVDYVATLTTVDTAVTLTLSHMGKVLETTAGTAVTITVPEALAVNFPVGTLIEIFQAGTGQITIAGATGVVLRSPGNRLKTAEQYSTVMLRKRAVDEWVVAGDLVA